MLVWKSGNTTTWKVVILHIRLESNEKNSGSGSFAGLNVQIIVINIGNN